MTDRNVQAELLAALGEHGDDFQAMEAHDQRQREENRAAIVERSDDVQTWDELLHLTGRLPGKNELPVLLFDLWGQNWFDENPAALAPALEDAWRACEFPSRAAAVDEWLMLFEAAGFINETVSDETARPRGSMRLYRGASPDAAAGMSWTDRLEVAQRFADRFRGVLDRKVWTANVEPGRLLARFHGDRGPREWEWVVDPRGLAVDEYRAP